MNLHAHSKCEKLAKISFSKSKITKITCGKVKVWQDNNLSEDESSTLSHLQSKLNNQSSSE